MCGQFSFREFLVSPYASSLGLQVPSNVASANYRVLLCCTCHFQSRSLFVYFVFLCLQVSSVSNFCPDTRGLRWSFMFNCAVGREGHCKQISLVCVGSARSVWATLGLPTLMACVLSRSTLLRLQVALPGNCGPWVVCTFQIYPAQFQVLGYSTKASVGPAFCPLPRSEQLR